MTRSHRNTGVEECLSDEFATTDARTYSRKAYRKKVRGIFGQTGKESKLDLECELPARDRKYWKSWTYTESKMEKQVDLRSNLEELKAWENLKVESTLNMKQKHQTERFEEWCLSKSTKVIRKKQKKLQREGMKTPYDHESTDSEVERTVDKWYRKKAFSGSADKLTEAKKYHETESLMSFSLYRKLKTK